MANGVHSGILASILLLGVAELSVQAALLGIYQFEQTSAVAAGANANVQWGNFTRTIVTASPDITRFASADWSTGTANDPTRYVSFTVQAQPGYQLSLTDITFNTYLPGSKPDQASVSVFVGGSSVATLPTFTPSASLVTFNFADIGPTSQQVQFRFYGWNAQNKNSVLAFDNVSVNGSVVPEPVNVALGTFGALLGFAGIGRRLYRDRKTT